MMQAAVELGPGLRGSVGEKPVNAEQVNEGNAAEPAAETPEKFTAIERSPIFGAQVPRPLL